MRALVSLAALFVLVHLAGPAQGAKCPNLLLVLDKSGSMTDSPAGGSPPPGGSKWDLAKLAIKQILERYDGQLPIGLSLFAPDGSCGAGRIEIAPDYETKAKILQKIDATDADSATPTSETIENLRMQPVLRDPTRAQYMILLTDGEPTCALNEPQATVTALQAACKQTPSISTFVVGFGSLPGSAADAMDRMAEAGCKPVMGMAHKYYEADSLASLTAALDQIFQVIVGEGMMSCDDTCYTNGCPNPGDRCIRAKCQPNPCTGISCGPGLYCYTDGESAGRCVAACKARCPAGQRCEMGRCIPDPCPAPCRAGYVCNAESKRCEADPLCPADPPRGQRCTPPSECQFGKCVDQPCLFITCPKNTQCVPWNGSCEFIGAPAAPDMGTGPADDDPGGKGRGCSASGLASSSSAGAVLLMLCALLLRRRRR